MELNFKAAYDKKHGYVPLMDDADTSGFAQVDTFAVTLKDSNIISLADADARAEGMSPKLPNGARSMAAESRVLPLAYCIVHVANVTVNGAVVKPTMAILTDYGPMWCQFVHGRNEAFDVTVPKDQSPQSTAKAGAKAGATNSAT